MHKATRLALTHSCVTPENFLSIIFGESIYLKGVEQASTTLKIAPPVAGACRHHLQTAQDYGDSYHFGSLGWQELR